MLLFTLNIKPPDDVTFVCHREVVLSYGIYWYSYAQTAEDAVEEAKKCIKTIKDKNLTYPVFYDVEESSNINSINELSVAFCEYMKSQGYSCGIC